MNKKLTKTRATRPNTLEAMAKCTSVNCDCTNCSGGGSFQVQGRNYSLEKELDHYLAYH